MVPPKAGRRLRRPLAVLLVAAVLLGGCLAALRARYRGLTSGLWNQARWTSFEESANLWAYIDYHLETVQRLTLDPASGVWDFRHTPEPGDDLERGKLAFHRGDYARAVALVGRAAAAGGGTEETLFWLGLATMREAEAANCLSALTGGHAGAHHGGAGHGGICTLPLRRLHDDPAPSRRAIEAFSRLLRRGRLDASDRRLVRWLLNVSAMTVGEWPGGVPEPERVESAFTDAFYGAAAERARREHADLRFVDRARELGVENLGNGRGSAVEDLDGDGDLDLVATGYFGGVTLFANEGGRFADRTAGSGLEGLRQPLGITPGDCDGDGDLDLFVTLPFSRFHLLENAGGGRFRDVTRASGLLDAVPPDALAVSWMAAWGDLDRDGDLDLAVAGWNLRVPWVRGLAARRRIDTALFENLGGGRFRDATAAWGLARLVRDQHFIGVAFGDYDADGWLDLFLASPLPHTTVLLHNRPAPGAAAAGGRRLVPSDRFDDPAPGFTAAFVDADHDGRLDLFRAGAGDARSSVAQAVFGDRGGRFRSGHSTILRQGEDGRFTPRDDWFAGGTLPVSTMGAGYGDLDNDGCLDFYLGTGSPEPWFVLPNLMFRGRRDGARCTGAMDNVSMLGGFGNLQKGHGVVFFDFDGDGDQDVHSSLGGMWPADRWTSQLFVNEGDGANAWVKIRLRGRESNGFGLGAQVTVRARRPDGSPLVRRRQMDHATGFGSAPYMLHVGLADATSIEEVEVAWLGSGCVGAYAAPLRALSVLDEADCLARPRSLRPR